MSHPESPAVTQPHAGRAMGMRGCEAHAECRSDRPGHGLHRMQERLASVAASRWIDAIVVGTDDEGFVTLADLDGAERRVWHHAPLAGVLASGEPVALHEVYGVLAFAGLRVSVADA